MYRLIIAGLVCLLFCTTCGLESVPYLPPPILLAPDNPRQLKIQTPVFPDINSLNRFRGIEIYYKFYKDDNIPTAESNISSQTSLEAYGYHRLVSAQDKVGNIGIPLISISPSDRDSSYSPFIIHLNFNVGLFDDEAEAIIDKSGYGTIILRRGTPNTVYTEDEIKNTAGDITTTDNLYRFKRFSDMNAADPDLISVATQVTLEQGTSLILAFYAITYGKDSLTTVYSQPVFLNSVAMSFTKR